MLRVVGWRLMVKIFDELDKNIFREFTSHRNAQGDKKGAYMNIAQVPTNRDVCLHKVVLRKIADSLLCNDDVRVECNYLCADVFNVLFLHSQQRVPVFLLRDFYIGLRLQVEIPKHEASQRASSLRRMPMYTTSRS